jgi:hypothetical protein
MAPNQTEYAEYAKAVALGVALVAALLLPSVCGAIPVTVEFTGHVTQVTDDVFGWFHGSVAVGMPITGTYTFESTTPDRNQAAGTGQYHSSSPGNSLDAFFSIYHLYSPSPLDITVTDQVGASDTYQVSAWTPTFLSPLNTQIVPLNFILDLRDDKGQVWSSDALPLGFPSFGNWSRANILFTAGYEVPDTVINGQLDSFAIASTPEPSTLLLLGTGLAGLGGVAWRRNRKG